jgi:acyl-CoA reductase-like NAD-dependent aldehyde dehydrogenase
MNRTVTGFLILLLAGPPLQADDKPKDKPSTPQEQYKTLVAEWQNAMKEYRQAMSKAKTQEERQKVFQEKYPQPDKFAPRFLELAEKNPKDPAGVDALIWVVEYSPPRGPAGKFRKEALEILARDHVTSDKLGPLCSNLGYARDAATESFLRAVLKKNPHREEQGQACLALAQMLKQRGGADKEAEQLFERAAKEYANIRTARGKTIGELAENDLFEIHHLAIGKQVPDIQGEDIDGKKFKLSDYHGKVVMLDFWGHW